MRIIATPRFDREFDRLLAKQPMMLSRVGKTLELLSSNPVHPSLRLHKLTGNRVYSASVTMSIRILFARIDDDIHLLRIGTHEEVY